MSAAFPTVLAPSEGEVFRAGPFEIVTRVSGDQSGGAFEMYTLSLGEATVDFHVHHTMDETLYVLEGAIEFQIDDDRFSRGPGSVAFVPRGVHHGFRNHGPERAKVLIVFSPARRQDEYFRALERLFAAPEFNGQALHAIQRQFDQELIEL